MTDSEIIFIAGLITAISAYFAKNFIFQPLLEFRGVKGRVQNRLKYNANKIHIGETETMAEVSKEFRELSCDLEEKYYAISFKKIVAKTGLIPEMNILSEAAKNLIFLSNKVGSDDYEHTYEAIEQIKVALKII